MSIFATPKFSSSETVRVLFLHGLEGSPSGEKALHLQELWTAGCPTLRTDKLIQLRSDLGQKKWLSAGKKRLNEALQPAYADACDAVRYMKPNVVVGSSMGGALLAKMVIEGRWSGDCVFLAPAIEDLLGSVTLPEMNSSVWVLGECDDIVTNAPNIQYCKNVRGNLIISPQDGHRLHRAVKNGLIDAAITTALEVSCHT